MWLSGLHVDHFAGVLWCGQGLVQVHLDRMTYRTLVYSVVIFFSCLIVHRFQVFVAPGTKLESGPATLHFCNDILVLVKDIPPSVMGQWKLSDLRRYGAVPNGFIFEGGTRCGFCKYRWNLSSECCLVPSAEM